MRRSLFVALLALSSTVSLGCGGAAPPPKPVQAAAKKAAPAKPPTCNDVASCLESCEAGDLAGCDGWYEEVRFNPIGVTVASAQKILERACSGGRSNACQALANVLSSSPDLTPDLARVAELRKRACDAGDALACLSAPGQASDTGQIDDATRAAIEGALVGLDERCNRHDGAACAAASAIVMAIDPNPQRAKSYGTRAGDELEASCLSGKGRSCMLGAMQVMSPMTPQPSRAKRLFERGCAVGFGAACTAYGRMTEATPDERAKRFDDACQKGDAEGCLEVAALKGAGGTDATRARERAIAIARAGCSLGETMACDTLVRVVRVVRVAPETAKDILATGERACDRGSLTTCNELATLYGTGPSDLRDAASAKRLTIRACDLGYPFACHDPKAALGLYALTTVPVLDASTGLEWAPVPPVVLGADEVEAHCRARRDEDQQDWRLPTRAELAGLAEPDDGLRAFASATSPKGGLILSSEAAPRKGDSSANGGSAKLAMNVRHGTFEVAEKGFVRCVRDASKAKAPPISRWVLTMKGQELEYELLDARGKRKMSSHVPLLEPGRSFQWVWDGTNFPGPADVEVASDVDWMTALRMLMIAQHDGLRVRRIVVPAPAVAGKAKGASR